MQQARIYWDLENYMQVEKIFRKSVEFCNDQDVWKLNVAHVLFMQESKYKEAAGFYEPIVKKHYENVNIPSLLKFLVRLNRSLVPFFELSARRDINNVASYREAGLYVAAAL